MAAAKAMLDQTHARLPHPPNDHNTYVLGTISGLNVVMACLLSGVYGTMSAATVAAQMLLTFPAIRFGLMVGIGGGVPREDVDIRLGDVVVSKPTDTFGGVVQYDYGKTVSGGQFQRSGQLNKPPQVLLMAVADLQSNHMMGLTRILEYLQELQIRYPTMTQFSFRGHEEDRLFETGYDHIEAATSCSDCDKSKITARRMKASTSPSIHYGLIALGNQVIKHGATRDRLARELGILCFEMEAAGLMDHFPCLVIRGICDYCDSHKNKLWQEYAAASAAAYAKELLSVVPSLEVSRIPTVMMTLSNRG
jgi:nucleoside phosphorylase